MLHVQLNGQALQFEPGTTLLAALERSGLHVPHLCHDDRLAPAGACRLCIVEVAGQPRPVTACTTPLTDGMAIETHSAALESRRRALLAWMARSHPRDAEAGPDNPFLREVHAYGLADELGAGHRDGGAEVDDTHPYIRVDMSRCIHCHRCERICAHVQGQFTWRVWNRGAETRFVPDSGTTLRDSSCVSCGACADSCPSGALTDKTVIALGAPLRWTRTTCPYCGVGCEMQVGSRDGRLVQVRPALDASVNKGHLCVKGRYAFGFAEAPDRVTTPMIRDGGAFHVVSWGEAIGFIADQLQTIRDRHGSDAIGVLGSARATNEENYLTQKFARVVLGTNNVDCCARVCHAPSAAALSQMLGTGAATNSFDDIEQARTLLVFGANATENHPVVGARLRQAALRGAHLVVADPRRIELARIASVHLQMRPGTDIPLLHAMAFTILNEGLADPDFTAARVDELEAFRRFVGVWTPERAAAVCGVDAASIRAAARLYATEKPAMCMHGLGMTEHVQGTETVMCLVNLALLTGNVGRPGAGVNPLRGQNNVQGSAHMGCEPHHLTGYVNIEHGRSSFERVWQAPVPRSRGLDLMQMMEAAGAGRLKALHAIGYDVLLTNPTAEVTRRALSRLELLVVQDMFMTETARELATVFLPAASSFEKDGTFMNAERRVQRVRRVVDAPGEARSDADILCALAEAMGQGDRFAFRNAEEIWNEIRSVWPRGAGISYERLERNGLQWPCPSEDHPGTRVLHSDSFASGPRAALRRIEYRPSAETCNDEYPLLLITGRRLYQFNAATMTGRTPNALLQPGDVLDVCEDDARRYGLRNGDRVLLRSRHGEARLPMHVDDRLQPGCIFATFHTADVFLNRLVGPQRDAVTHTPEYKVTAVRLEKC